jgi:hypothetical protein
MGGGISSVALHPTSSNHATLPWNSQLKFGIVRYFPT